jgi:hypothetical protein
LNKNNFFSSGKSFCVKFCFFLLILNGGLYHNASKDFHGHSHAVEIVSKKPLNENEIIALPFQITLS